MALALFVFGLGLGWGASLCIPSELEPSHLISNLPGVSHLTGPGSGVQAVTATVDPAIVDVNTDLGAGTGMIVGPSGEALTNNHVIEDASTILLPDEQKEGSHEAERQASSPPDP